MSARRPPGRRLRGQGGETLIELLATVTVMGITAVAVLFAIAAGIRFSTSHRTQSNTAVALGAAAESVKDYPAAPTCAGGTSSYYSNGALAPTRFGASALFGELPSGWSTSNLSIVAGLTGCNNTSAGACGGMDLQTVTVQATPPTGGASQRVTICKRTP